MSKIMYRATIFGIKAIEVEKETDKTVVVAGQREAKNTDFHVWRATFEDAKNALIYNIESEVNKQQRRLNFQTKALERIKATQEAQ